MLKISENYDDPHCGCHQFIHSTVATAMVC